MRTLILLFLALSLSAASASAETYVVDQVGNGFQPQDITINLGDTVRWVWNSGGHTVTEGTDGTIDGDEAFHGLLNSSNQTYEVTFDQAFLIAFPRPGDLYDYFCEPHFGVGMVGTVAVSDGPGVVFCHCDGNGAWPVCLNWAWWGEGCRNSSGVGAELRSHGSASVAADDLTFSADDLLPFQPALLFVGDEALSGGDGIAFGDGLRCVGTNVVRLGIVTPDANGHAAWGPGLAALGGWAGGETRYFQVWYRDPVGGPCGTSFNLSNGLEVGFLP